MFGHDHDDDKPKDDEFGGSDQAIATDADQVVAPDKPTKSVTNGDGSWQHPGAPPKDDQDESSTEDFTAGHSDSTPANDASDDTDTPEPFGAPVKDTALPSSHPNDDLIDIKQEALGKLSPLVGHLDQTPDEKFRTLMMMIQASDDQSLIKQAYDTALEIEDEKTRAQALLDIVNEINYFTQNPVKTD